MSLASAPVAIAIALTYPLKRLVAGALLIEIPTVGAFVAPVPIPVPIMVAVPVRFVVEPDHAASQWHGERGNHERQAEVFSHYILPGACAGLSLIVMQESPRVPPS